MTLTYSQAQKEQVWRALGWTKHEDEDFPVGHPDRIYWLTPDEKHSYSCRYPHFPKPEDVLWQLRELAIEKDADCFAGLLYNSGPAEGSRMVQVACATPQQIFEACLQVLGDK